MAIKKQKRCRKIRPVSAFISESPAPILTALFPFFFFLISPACFFPAPPANPSNTAVPTGGSPQDMESQLGSLGVPPGWFSGLGNSQPTASGSWEGLAELPTHGYKLRHQTQGRPRPPRTTPPGPGRPSVSLQSLVEVPTSLSNARARGCNFRTQMSEAPALGDVAEAHASHRKWRDYPLGAGARPCQGKISLPDSGSPCCGKG